MQARNAHKRRLPIDPIAGVLLLITAIIVAVAAVVSTRSGGETAPPRAAIVDQLAGTYPDPAFIADVTASLARAGFQVDYIPADQVTVDLFRHLPSQHYSVIIFRNHASRTVAVHQPGTSETVDFPLISLFTSELYDASKYRDDAGRLFKAHYDNGRQEFFSISPLFIRDSIKGKFDHTVVIAMGCDGLSSTSMAQAFMDKGAESFISWNKPVTADHTDTATDALVRHLFVDHLGVSTAIDQTMHEVGPDPAYGSVLAAVQSAQP